MKIPCQENIRKHVLKFILAKIKSGWVGEAHILFHGTSFRHYNFETSLRLPLAFLFVKAGTNSCKLLRSVEEKTVYLN